MPKQPSQFVGASLKSSRKGKLLSLPMLPDPNDKKYAVPPRSSLHHVVATITGCIDPDFFPKVYRYFCDRYGEGNFEMPQHAGGARQFAEGEDEGVHRGLTDIRIALEKHHAEEVVLLTHEDCAAYGGSVRFGNDFAKELAFHKTELQKAAEKVRAIFPDVRILKIFHTFNGPREI